MEIRSCTRCDTYSLIEQDGLCRSCYNELKTGNQFFENIETEFGIDQPSEWLSDDTEIREQYWVNKPYAFVQILSGSTADNGKEYAVREPKLEENEREFLNVALTEMDTSHLFADATGAPENLDTFKNELRELPEANQIEVTDELAHRLYYYARRDSKGYGQIDPMLRDENVLDISCDKPSRPLYVYYDSFGNMITNVVLDSSSTTQLIEQLAREGGQSIEQNTAKIETTLPNTAYLQATHSPEQTEINCSFTVRTYNEFPVSPTELIERKIFDSHQLAYLWLAIENDKNIFLTGETPSNTSWTQSALSMLVPPESSITTIQGKHEVSVPEEGWVSGTAHNSLPEAGGSIDKYSLAEATLRRCPDYVFASNISGEEAEPLFQGMSTGHTTCLTMHAESVGNAVKKLVNSPNNVTKQMISSLDIICLQNQIRFKDDNGNIKNARRNDEICEITRLQDDGMFESYTPYLWNPEEDTHLHSVGDSTVLSEIAYETGQEFETVQNELQRRANVLEFLATNEYEIETVARTLQLYMHDPDWVLNQIRNGSIDTQKLKERTVNPVSE